MSILLNKTIRLFLDSIGRREEYEYYLERFSAERTQAFAILVPEREVFEEASGVLAFDMSFLLRLGLDPVVLLCGPDADAMCMLLQAEDRPFLIQHVCLADLARAGDPPVDWLEDARAGGKALVLADATVNVEQGLMALVPALSRRVHFIRMRGPLHDAAGKPLFFYQTQTAGAVALSMEDEGLAQLAVRLLHQVPGLHISAASPLQLLEELFTVKGAGCLIRRGAVIKHFQRLAEVDEARLIALLESSFGKRVRHRGFLEAATDFYIEAQYKGAVILEPYEASMYLSKFAVQTEARGEGLAIELWRALLRDYPSVFWRSNSRNPINHWYDRQADGCHVEDGWKVYWRGITVENLPSMITSALARPQDFEQDPIP